MTNNVLARHYADNKGPVAFLDESYSADPHHGAMFHLVSAVIVEPDQIDPTRPAGPSTHSSWSPSS